MARDTNSMRRILFGSAITFSLMLLFGSLLAFKLLPNSNVESIGYQYAMREDISSLPSLAIPAGYTSLNPQSFLSGRKRIERLANEIVVGKTTELEKAIALVDWVQIHVRPQTSAPTTVITDDYVNIIKRGWGYCDQMAHVFATMATYVGLEAKQLQLYRKDGVSPHTLAIVKLDGEWRIASVWRGIIPLNSRGEPYTLTGFINLLERNDAYEFASAGITAEDFRNSKEFSTFPYAENSVILKKIIYRIVGKLKSLVPRDVSIEQTETVPSLKLLEKVETTQKELTLFDAARNAHIDMDYVLARNLYVEVLSTTTSSVLRDLAQYQLGMSYFDAKQYESAQEKFEEIIEAKNNSAWEISAKRMVAESWVRLGEIQKAIRTLDTIGTIQSRVRAQELRDRASL